MTWLNKFKLSEKNANIYHNLVTIVAFICLFLTVDYNDNISKSLWTIMLVVPIQIYSRYLFILYLKGYGVELLIPFYPYYAAWFHYYLFKDIEIEWEGPTIKLTKKEIRLELSLAVILIILFLIYGI